MKYFYRCILPAFALLFLSASCSGDGDDREAQPFLSDIVTVGQSGDAGTRFTFRRYGDSPLITLDDPKLKLEEKYVGTRVLLRYYPESGKPYTDGTIRAVGLSAINNDTTVIRPVGRYGWDADPVYLNSIWRSGSYINLHLRAVYSTEPRYFSLMVDSLTLTDPVPQVYLVHNTLGAPDNYMTEVYSSVDISNVWGLPGCRAIEVHVNDCNLKNDIYIFNK